MHFILKRGETIYEKKDYKELSPVSLAFSQFSGERFVESGSFYSLKPSAVPKRESKPQNLSASVSTVSEELGKYQTNK